ncbi:glycosyltransferase [Fibrella aquatilis]|uniref:Glycosyltransferase family 2 protein n=1 Tax=Fibrella aquatilis TaxID=2817059 RepID=A0A939G495_9BACT|nr:glycosyltransferase family A protein [Fibrella aquatilis]MBO0930150.1 glycosyltransferase family 2 protein [Fibrella aquatilis]
MLAEYRTLADDGTPADYLFALPPSPNLRVSVVVPVRNESAIIAHTLDALRNQLTCSGHPLDPTLYEVLVLTNNCTDDSFACVQRYQRQHPNFALHVANIQLGAERAHIGTVRRLLMDEACRRLLLAGHSRSIIASTDGDTLVDDQWISQIIREIDAGADAVGGRILTHREDGPARLPHLRDATYRHLLAQAEARIDPCPYDPWPRHFQHFGASLAVTCQAYIRAGRLPVVRYLEDDALVKALCRIDAKVRRSPAVRVYTSARLQGRVEVGLSWQLQQWACQRSAGQCQQVENPSRSLARFQLRHQLRQAWAHRFDANCMAQLRPAASQLGVSAGWLLAQMATSTYFGQFWEIAENQFTLYSETQPLPCVPIIEAIATLRSKQI